MQQHNAELIQVQGAGGDPLSALPGAAEEEEEG